jgi:hypothetical protein
MPLSPAGACTTLTKVLDWARTFGRLFLGPLIAAAITGVELSRYGAFTAGAAAYLIFHATQSAIVAWNRHQLRRAVRRIAVQRNRRRRAAS